MAKKINVFVCDDHLILLDGITQILHLDPMIHVVGVAQTFEEARETILSNTLEIDLIILDIKIGERSGLELAKWITSQNGKIGLVFLSMFEDVETIQQAIQLGCLSYLPKNIDSEELILAIKASAKGLNYFPASIFKLLTNKPEITSFEKTKLKNNIALSERELQVLKCILNGETSSQIGESLFLSVHTVNTYKKSLFKKFEVQNVVSLVIKTIQQYA